MTPQEPSAPPPAGATTDATSDPAPTASPLREAARLLTDVHGLPKPVLRGRIHLAAFVLSVPAGILLVAQAAHGLAVTAAVIYAVCLTALFGASSAYHRLGRTPRSQQVLRRLDHASIYLLIAGSYTPLCLLVLPGAWRWSILVAIWGAAAVGVVIKLVRFDLSVFGGALYIVMGWAALVTLPLLVSRLPGWVLALLAAGGVTYTVGAIVLRRRRPDPSPRIFGYHEVWHTMTVAAGACHWAVMFHVVSAS